MGPSPLGSFPQPLQTVQSRNGGQGKYMVLRVTVVVVIVAVVVVVAVAVAVVVVGGREF